MTGRPLTQPAWVEPRRHEVADLIALASISTQDSSIPTATRYAYGAMLSASAWVSGLLFGPITHRDDAPVTLDVARAELFTAETLLYPERRAQLSAFCASTGVRSWTPVETQRDYVLGAWVTLRWLIGLEAAPPIPVPLRHEDGSLLTETEIYEGFLAGEPAPGAARRQAIRRTAATMAQESYNMARTIRIHSEHPQPGQ